MLSAIAASGSPASNWRAIHRIAAGASEIDSVRMATATSFAST